MAFNTQRWYFVWMQTIHDVEIKRISECGTKTIKNHGIQTLHFWPVLCWSLALCKCFSKDTRWRSMVAREFWRLITASNAAMPHTSLVVKRLWTMIQKIFLTSIIPPSFNIVFKPKSKVWMIQLSSGFFAIKIFKIHTKTRIMSRAKGPRVAPQPRRRIAAWQRSAPAVSCSGWLELSKLVK